MSHNQCPFCEHINPVDAKFCNDCGAVLHLVPCPKCGAVNDVAATACYRCHMLLKAGVPGHAALPVPATREKSNAPDIPELAMAQAKHVPAAAKPAPTAAKPGPVAAKPVIASVVPTAIAKAPVNTTSGAAQKAVTKTATMDAASAGPRPSINHRPPLLVIGIVIAAFALATYYAYRQRTTVTPRDAAVAAPVGIAKDATGASSAGAIEKSAAPPVVPTPAATAGDKTGSAIDKKMPAREVKAAPTMPNSTVVPPPANVSAMPVTQAAPTATAQPAAATAENAADAARPARRRPAQIVPDKPATSSAPCTEAVAALGLCTPDPNQRR